MSKMTMEEIKANWQTYESLCNRLEDKNIDMRVSTIPSIYGEKVCIRILDKTRIPLDLDKLGINEVSLGRFKDVLSKPFGMVLVTGPTGSGKTTTLYACLNYLNDVKKNINTIEDPVEYKLEGINQVHVRPDIGLDFSEALRSFLRQDPDIIMVGEIRDNKTADMCVRAALTGHLVLSTLHTNSAVQAIDRLINIGVDPILIISSVELISAQRLVRKLCSACKKEYRPSNAIIKKYNIKDTDKIYKAVGCNKCKKIGYSGRVPLHETLILDEEIKEMIYNKEASFKVEEKACEKGMISLRQCGIAKVKLGITTLEEIMAATI